MNLIKLTEYKHSKAEDGTKIVEEVPVLINPEGIESVVTTKLENESGIPIIGETENERPMSGLMMRSGRKHAIKETLEEIWAIIDQREAILNDL